MTSPATEAELIGKLLATMDRIDGKTTELQQRIDGKMHLLPSGLQDKVRNGWNQFVDLMKNAWAAWRKIAANLGSPSALTHTADMWSDQVGAPVSGQVQTADAGTLNVDDNWDGDAADAYRATLPQQKTALEKIKSVFVDGIGAALSQVATGIYQFLAALITGAVVFVGALVAALLSAATIFGLPAAPFLAAIAAAAFIAAVYVAMRLLSGACRTASTTLRQKLDDNTAFREGHWPPAANY